MTAVLALLAVQGLLGAFDNLWHHEITEKLPSNPAARAELILHTIRELIYALIFLSIGWLSWEGAWAYLLIALLLIEIGITLTDFVIEDLTRKLPALERILHTVLAVNFGAILAVWAPFLLVATGKPTDLAPVSYGTLSWIMTLYGLGVFAWGIRDLWAVWQLTVPDWQRIPFAAPTNHNPKHILVTGGTGFIGQALVRALVSRGDKVTLHTRQPARARFQFGPHVTVVSDLGSMEDAVQLDAIINLAGAPILGGLWTPKRRRVLTESRVVITHELHSLCARLVHRPRTVINASAVGFYGERGDEVLNDDATPGTGFLAELCKNWETAATELETLGIRVCLMRFGLVLDPTGGMLRPMQLAGKLGMGAVLGDGRQWMPWITRHDLVRAILFVLEDQKLRGPINAVTPNPVTNRAFVDAIGRSLHRPRFLRVPEIVLKKTLGEMSDLMLISQRVKPGVLKAAGFEFLAPELETALNLWNTPARSKTPETSALRVIFNDECPVCAREMGVYARESTGPGAPIAFCALTEHAHDLEAYGLSPEDLKRRLYVLDVDGTVHSGLGALVAIWRDLPRFRWLARLFGKGPAAIVGSAIYEWLCVPLLAAFNKARDRKRKGPLRRAAP